MADRDASPSRPSHDPRTSAALPNGVYDLLLLGVVLIWGINFPITKAALDEVHPLVFNAMRFTLGTVLLGALGLREARNASRASTPGLAFSMWPTALPYSAGVI